MRESEKVVARFWAKVDKSGECWLWTASTSPQGYGQFRHNGTMVGAHRLAYKWAYGPISEGIKIDHTCHTIACVKPTHLRPTTNKQNAENRGALNRNNTSGYRGVSWAKRDNAWVAKIKHNQVIYNLGYFETAAAASQAVVQKRNELFTHNDKDRVEGLDALVNEC